MHPHAQTTLRAYVAMLRMEDALYGHPFYARAAAGAVRAYLALADGEEEGGGSASAEVSRSSRAALQYSGCASG